MKSNWKRRYNQPAIITSTGLAALVPQILLSVRIIWASSSQMRCISLGPLRSQSKHLAQGENSPGAIRRHHHIGEKLQALKIFHGGKVRRFFLHRPFSSFSFCGIFISSGQSSLIRTVSLTPKNMGMRPREKRRNPRGDDKEHSRNRPSVYFLS